MKAVIILSVLCVIASVEAVVMNCGFYVANFDALGTVYRCDVKNNLFIITRKEAIIDSVTPAPDQDVKGLYAYGKTIHFLPQNLGKVFPMLEGLRIQQCSMKEVKKEDLRNLPNLKVIEFYISDIEVIEKDLFEYNPNLEFVHLEHGKIFHIDPIAFNNLHKLNSLLLFANKCISRAVRNNATAVKSFVTELKSKCVNPQYSDIDNDLRDLRDPKFLINSESSFEKLNQLKSKLDASKLSPLVVTSFKKRLDDIFELKKIDIIKALIEFQMTKNKETDNRLITLNKNWERSQAGLKVDIMKAETKLEESIKQTQNDLKRMQVDMTARMSALEAMTQKILEMVGNSSMVEEPDMSRRCGGEWEE